MKGLEERLDPGEWFIFAGRPHWIRFVPLIAAAVIGGVVAFKFGAASVPVACWVVIALGCLVLGIETFRSNFIVTNRRVILDHAIFRRSLNSVPLEQIADITLSLEPLGVWAQTAMPRVETTDGRVITVPWLWRARTFRRLVLEQRKQLLMGTPTLV